MIPVGPEQFASKDNWKENSDEGYSADKEVTENHPHSNSITMDLGYTAEKEPFVANSPSNYPGDYIEEDQNPIKEEIGKVRSDGYQCLEFPNPAVLLAFYNPRIREGEVTLYPWQANTLEEWANAKATAMNPYKFPLLTCNGSGKDAFMIAGWAIWFTLCKIRSRVIITTSSGTQLTAQTEPGIRAICQLINDFHGCEIFRIRQRYFYCRLTGSEIRLFATDEAGKAEGYHPIEPGAEMTIIVNEAKSVSPEIHGALRRCNGYNYWFEISSAGEPVGDFYKAFTNWPNKLRITSYDCPKHLSLQEIEQDKIDLGEHSALFRSIHLALFTSVSGEVIISSDLIEQLLNHFKTNPRAEFQTWQERIGLDLAAGGDENALCKCRGNKAVEKYFREKDTEVSAERIDHILSVDWKIPKTCKHIYGDDGGVGRSIIDKLEKMGWTINRVLNQSTATLRKIYGNRGAENWYRVLRILEERCFDVSTLTEKTREQLYTRRYKASSVGGRIFLEAKKDAIAHGRPSPDRADAFILSQTGLTVNDYLNADKPIEVSKNTRFNSAQEILDYFDEHETFNSNKHKQSTRKAYGSLSFATRSNDEN